MKVLKFGGTSVANAENIQKTVNIIKRSSEPKIVVVSALGGVTDQLIKTGIRVIPRHNNTIDATIIT